MHNRVVSENPLAVNVLSANFTKWLNTLEVADELFECVWPFVGLTLKGLNF